MIKTVMTKEYEEKLLNNYACVVRELAKQASENADILVARSLMHDIKVPVKKRISYKIMQLHEDVGMLFLRIFFHGLYKNLMDYYNHEEY